MYEAYTASNILSFLETTLKILTMQHKIARPWHRSVAVVVLLLVHSAVVRDTSALSTRDTYEVIIYRLV